MVLDPIPQPLPVYVCGSRPQPPTTQDLCKCKYMSKWLQNHVKIVYIYKYRCQNWYTCQNEIRAAQYALIRAAHRAARGAHFFLNKNHWYTCQNEIRAYWAAFHFDMYINDFFFMFFFHVEMTSKPCENTCQNWYTCQNEIKVAHRTARGAHFFLKKNQLSSQELAYYSIDYSKCLKRWLLRNCRI